jgi:mono/diheme cytochrome c family protein
MKNVSLAVFVLALSILVEHQVLTANENSENHPIVPGFERFAQVEEIADAERGMLLLNELNCTSCHQSDLAWSISPKQAPILTDVGDRILPEYFESYLLNPHSQKPGTTMPDVLSGKPENEKKQIAESLAHYLASTGKSVKQSSNAALVAKGDKLFHSIGCVACHNPQNEDAAIATSAPLVNLETKYTLPGLTEFLQNPLHVRPSGRMPQFNLAGDEAQAIASYLLRDVVVESKVNYTYYEGEWEKLPNFDQLKPVSSGTAAGFEVRLGRPDLFGIVFQGFWSVANESEFEFRLSSDDGSRLIIDGTMVVENDGIHGVTTQTGKIKLAAGVHDVRLEFFEKAGGEVVRVEVSGGGLKRAGLDSLLRATELEAEKPADAFKLDPAKAQAGQIQFRSLGCAKCHEIDSDKNLIETEQYPLQKSLNQVNPQRGCLSGAAGAPAFGLSDFQIRCITSAIEQLKNPPATAADLEQPVHQKLMTLNCYGCHSRQRADKLILGGVVDVTGDSLEVYDREKWFTGKFEEMGDEGKHPPVLKSVGAKLAPEWLKTVLNQSANDRPYMLTRMPKFGQANLGQLVEELIAADKLKDVPQVTQSESERKVKAHGRFFAGEDALSCIKCHTFGKYPATGIQALDLTTMTKRLNKDWFQVYMLKPSRFRRGTRMPESWPGGKSFYPDILDGDTNKQIDALWAFLSDGETAAKPKGLVRSKMELKPIDTPVIYRNFIEGAGPRAIGVGYPEQVNLAFDAQLCRLALLWQENFIDASRHWTGRGQGFEPPLGENLLRLPNSVVMAANLDDNPWTSDLSSDRRPRFKGYRFDEQRRPIFKYEINDIMVEDHPIPFVIDDRPLLKRELKITSPSVKKVFFLPVDAGASKSKSRIGRSSLAIESACNARDQQTGFWRIRAN